MNVTEAAQLPVLPPRPALSVTEKVRRSFPSSRFSAALDRSLHVTDVTVRAK